MASFATLGMNRWFCRPAVRLLLLPAIAAVLFPACAETAVDDPTPDRAFVFGYIDMINGPGPLLGVTLYRLSPSGGTPYVTFNINDGTFYSANVLPGSYYLQEFRNVSRTGGLRQANSIPAQAKPFQLTVAQPGQFYFMGSFRYEPIETKRLDQAQFDLQPINRPSEKDVLAKLMPLMRGKAIRARAEAHLQTLQ